MSENIIKCPECGEKFTAEEGMQHQLEEFKKILTRQNREKRDKEVDQKVEAKLKQDREKRDKEVDQKVATKMKKEKANLAERESKLEKDRTSLKKEKTRVQEKIEESLKMSKQGPVELQGEVQQDLLLAFLKKNFPQDKFESVKKGMKGGDVIHTVLDRGKEKGKILHESKDWAKFDEKWISKLLKDMTDASATVGFIFTSTMPRKSNSNSEEREGGRIIICSNDYWMHAIIISLNRKLIIQQIDPSKISGNLSTAKDKLYNYINSNEFKLLNRRNKNSLIDESNQIEKDNRLFEKQIKDRQKNFKEKEGYLRNMITSILSSAGLPDDFLEDENIELIE